RASNGDILLAGTFDATFSFASRQITNHGDEDGFVVSFSSSSVPMTGGSIGGAQIDRIESIAADKNGVWVSGLTHARRNLDPAPGEGTLTGGDAMLAKYSNGSFSNVKSWGGKDNDAASRD